ncbi:vanadium-dependent haloperoxidase [Thalassobacillus sp. B23F22_16]|uniref:vanadium-dependent haloperoxidase n=1 Tax=Thalassobacillus sp. B23F22_16 TaxID=3459513 RepID=UPI00373E5376
MRTAYRRWSAYPYQGEQNPPTPYPAAASYPMFFITRGENNSFLNPFGQPIKWKIKDPSSVHWESELLIVEQTLSRLTSQQMQIANYWANAETTENMTPIIFHLAKKYKLGSPLVARILAYFHAGINDAFVISWYFKYLWDVARPNQYGRNINPILPTPRFPAYPSAHATVAGCGEVILSNIFPADAPDIKTIMEQCAMSRLYAGVHFKVDNDEGLRLGRQIGEMVVEVMKRENSTMNRF